MITRKQMINDHIYKRKRKNKGDPVK